MSSHARIIKSVAAASAIAMASLSALAACSNADAGSGAYPEKPIQVIVPFGAGGGTDQHARLFTTTAKKMVDVPVRPVTMSGAGGTEGTRFVADSDPNGYTLLYATTGSIVTTPLLEDVGYSKEDFKPIAAFNEPAFILAVKGDDSRFNSLDDVVKYSKENPGKLTFGTSGVGASQHTGMLALQDRIGTHWKHVPFDGGPEATLSTIAGDTDLAFITVSTAIEPLEDGKLKAIATSSSERLEVLQDIPTFRELGLDFTYTVWRGLLAPAGTPDEVTEYLIGLAKEVFSNPEFKKGSFSIDREQPALMESDEFASRIEDETKRFEPLM